MVAKFQRLGVFLLFATLIFSTVISIRVTIYLNILATKGAVLIEASVDS